MSKTWFIAGASRGLGRAWAIAALERGDRVAATVRDEADLRALAKRYGGQLLVVRLDVADRAAVFAAVEKAANHFGRLDIVIANAGYALFGTVEESSEQASRAQFDTNFFGALWVAQAALPRLRAQGAGHILVTSSLAGIVAFPTAGVYNATKWAVEGLFETLALEVAQLGIKVTLIEPGGYATDWRGASADHAEEMAAYDGLREELRANHVSRQLGDPAATGPAILAVTDAAEPPLRLFLGTMGLPAAERAYAERLRTWQAWQSVSAAAQGDAPAQ